MIQKIGEIMAEKFLTLREVANHLKITDSVVKEMIKAKVFPTKKVSGSDKIKKADVEEWLANLNEREVEQLAINRSVTRFTDYFNQDNIILDFQASNRYEAIGEMSRFAKKIKVVRDHRWLYKVVIAREELVSTAVGNGVALLHPRHFHQSKIKKPTILLGRSNQELEFESIDNKPVNIFFMLLLHNDAQHLFSISYISKLLLHKNILKKLKTTDSKAKIVELITTEIQKNKCST